MEVMRRHLASFYPQLLRTFCLAVHHGQQSQKVGDACAPWLPVPWDHDILLGPHQEEGVELVPEKSTKWCRGRGTESDGHAQK